MLYQKEFVPVADIKCLLPLVSVDSQETIAAYKSQSSDWEIHREGKNYVLSGYSGHFQRKNEVLFHPIETNHCIQEREAASP